MKKVKYLTALFIGTFIYVLISVLFGQNGLWAENQLMNQKRIISARTAEIQSINDELNLEKTAIQNDVDVIAAYARKLDYVFNDEKIVKIKGLPYVQTETYATGSVLKQQSVAYVPEWICKALGLCISSLMFIILFLKDIISMPKRKSFEVIEGIPIYDVSQI